MEDLVLALVSTVLSGDDTAQGSFYDNCHHQLAAFNLSIHPYACIGSPATVIGETNLPAPLLSFA